MIDKTDVRKKIPIAAAKQIAEEYGYDQVVILARKIPEGSHATTYGANKAHCEVAAAVGRIFLDLEKGKNALVQPEIEFKL